MPQVDKLPDAVTREDFAFPWVADRAGHLCTGMTLRDWFAGQLSAAEVASAGANRFAAEALADAAEEAGQSIEERIAFNAYKVADAMIEARKL